MTVPFYSILVRSPPLLHPSLGSPKQKRYRAFGEGTEEGHEDIPRTGAPPLQGQAERTGPVQPGKERLWGDLIVALQYLKGVYKHEENQVEWFLTKGGEIQIGYQEEGFY